MRLVTENPTESGAHAHRSPENGKIGAHLGGHPASRGCQASLPRVPRRPQALSLPPVFGISGSGGKQLSQVKRSGSLVMGTQGVVKSGTRLGDQYRKPSGSGRQSNSLSTAEVTQELPASRFRAEAREGRGGSWAGLEAARSVRGRAVTLAPPRFLVGVPPPRVQVPSLSWVLGNVDFPPSGRDLPSLHLLLSPQVRPRWRGSWPGCAAPARCSRSRCGRGTPPATASRSWCSAPCPTRSWPCSVLATGATRGE